MKLWLKVFVVLLEGWSLIFIIVVYKVEWSVFLILGVLIVFFSFVK